MHNFYCRTGSRKTVKYHPPKQSARISMAFTLYLYTCVKCSEMVGAGADRLDDVSLRFPSLSRQLNSPRPIKVDTHNTRYDNL